MSTCSCVICCVETKLKFPFRKYISICSVNTVLIRLSSAFLCDLRWTESAKSRAWSAYVLACLHVCVLTCLACLRACVLTYLACLRGCVLTWLRAHVFGVLTCLRAYVFGVFTCLRAWRAYVLAWLRAWCVCVCKCLFVCLICFAFQYLNLKILTAKNCVLC